MALQEAHELDRDAVGGLGEEFGREGEVAHLKVRRMAVAMQYCAREEKECAVALECVGCVVQDERSFAFIAEYDGARLQTAALILKKIEVAASDRELLVGNHA